jgi:hypothetical protein
MSRRESLLSCSLLIACIFLNSGCITASVREKAAPKEEWNPDTKKLETEPGHPSYYALLPLSIPADIAISPFQFVGFMYYAFTVRGH